MDDSPRFRSAGYSSDVRLTLVVADRKLPLRSIGPTSIVLREPTELPPCEAQIIMTVDGNEVQSSVFLVSGAQPTEPEVAVEIRSHSALEAAPAG